LKQHKAWFDEEGSRYLDQRKQAKIQWLQGPSRRNIDSLNKIPEARRNKRKNICKLQLINFKPTVK